MDATTDTRPAARAGSTPAALIPTGKPSAAPAPHNNAPATAQGSDGPNTTNSSPAAASPAVTRSTAGRPHRSSAPPPTRRDTVMAVTKTPKPSAPRASLVPCPSTNATVNQSLATPSVKAKLSTSNPISSVRRSRQARSVCAEERTSPSAAPGTGRNQRAATTTAADTSTCLLYTSDAADEEDSVDLGGR